MDANQCLAHIASVLGVTIPHDGQSADYVTGLIVAKIQDGPGYQLVRTILEGIDMLMACNNQGMDADEMISQLSESHGEWTRRAREKDYPPLAQHRT